MPQPIMSVTNFPLSRNGLSYRRRVLYNSNTADLLWWRHNERDGVSNRRRLDGLLNRLFRCESKKTSNLRLTGLCEGTLPVTSKFPSRRPVTRKMFPFDVVIMHMHVPLCEKILINYVLMIFSNLRLHVWLDTTSEYKHGVEIFNIILI